MPFFAWLVAIATFLGFAGVSGYFGAVGVASCGCLGAIKTSPWVAFGIDLTALTLLAVGRPGWRPGAGAELRRSARTGLRWAGGVAVILAVLTAAATLLAGSPRHALARLRGETVTADGYLDFGAGPAGGLVTQTATLQNWTDQPVRVVGGTSDCSCTTTEDLPVTLPPGGEAAVRIRMTIPAASRGQLTRTVELWTDSPRAPKVRFTVGCRAE